MAAVDYIANQTLIKRVEMATLWNQPAGGKHMKAKAVRYIAHIVFQIIILFTTYFHGR